MEPLRIRSAPLFEKFRVKITGLTFEDLHCKIVGIIKVSSETSELSPAEIF